MNDLQIMRWFLIVFPLAGLGSALVTVYCQPRLLGHEDFLGGVVFGTAISACYWVFLPLRSIWKAAVFVVISAVSAYLAFISAALAHDYAFHLLRIGGGFEPELFVGGLVGAFVLLAAIQFLFLSERRLGRVFMRSIFGALIGGLLGVIGSTAGPLFGGIRRRLSPHHTDSDVSLIFVWQIGMAFVFALTLWFQKRSSRVRSPRQFVIG